MVGEPDAIYSYPKNHAVSGMRLFVSDLLERSVYAEFF